VDEWSNEETNKANNDIIATNTGSGNDNGQESEEEEDDIGYY
jgi:hypothetical protein